MEKVKNTLLPGFLLLVIIALLVFIYYNTFAMLVIDWGINPDYSHGYLIPFISIYMMWHALMERHPTVYLSSMWELLPFLAGVALQVVALVGAEHFLQGVSLVVVLWGLSLFLGGKEVARCLAVPVGYLIFMIPLPSIIWNKISLLLKLQASNITSFLLSTYGSIPFMQEGNIFHLTSGALEVADACSGLRSLISMLALGVLIAFISRYTLWKKWVLVIAAFPIAIIANIIRLVLLVFLADRYGISIAESFMHTLSGILVFVIGLIMLFGVHVLLASKGQVPMKSEQL